VRAQARRERELETLAGEGVAVRTLGKTGHWQIGDLHIYTQCGRWLNTFTGRRGRLNGRSMRRLIQTEYYDVMLRPGQQLCPEAQFNTERIARLYEKYNENRQCYQEQTHAYEEWMRTTRAASHRIESGAR
jgi:hypothetical protein